MKEMKELYDKNPENWRVLAGRSPNEFNDIFFCQLNENNLWQIKAEQMDPLNIIGIGAKVKNVDEEITKKIMDDGRPYFFGMMVPQEKGAITAAGPMKYSDDSVKDLKKEISKENELLNKLLKKRLRELIEKEHGNRFDMFG